MQPQDPRQHALQSQLVRAATLLRQGQLPEAEESCRQLLAAAPEHPAALHLLGLIREQSGDMEAGETLLRQSIAREPRNLDFHLNLAHLLRRRGALPQAEAQFRQALALDPGNHAARHGLAHTLADLGRFDEAGHECQALLSDAGDSEAAWLLMAWIRDNQNRSADAEVAYRKVLQLAPGNAQASLSLGAMLARIDRAEEALVQLEHASALGAPRPLLLAARARSLTALNRSAEAEQCYADALALDPLQIEAQVNLAQLRFMRGDADFSDTFAEACTAHPQQPALRLSLAVALRCAGRYDDAERRVRALLAELGPVPELRSELAQVLLETGRLQEAEIEALEAVAGKAGESMVVENLVAVLLARDRPEDALPFIKTQRAREPLLQNWLAYEATAARLLRHADHARLCDYDRLIKVYDLAAPAGWSSMTEFNAELLAVLQRRHVFVAQPFDQSLRNGSQSMRNLVTEQDPVIRALLGAFAPALQDYLQRLGRDPSHPVSARNTGAATIVAAWSVQMRRGGLHLNHVHTEGWISSAYYVEVPEEAQDPQLKAGWLKFGEPRFPAPGLAAEKFVQPRPGRLVLFPSYFWHGTNPIHGEQARMAAAFDAVPAG